MPHSSLTLHVEPHPILRPRAFTSTFPKPLGRCRVPPWVGDLLDLNAQAPLERSEAVRLRVRDMLRHWGHKPAGRGKPASEYLIRAVKRAELSSINLAVDICNVVSLHSGFPIALVDLARIQSPLLVRPGREDESYVFNPSGQEMALQGLICLTDDGGPCANPVKDAQRVKTGDDTTDTLTILWGAEGFPDRLDAAENWYREMLESAGAEVETVAVSIRPSPGSH